MKIELAGLPMILFIVFLILRLCKVIVWSWWWVTCPLWIMALLALAVMVLYFCHCRHNGITQIQKKKMTMQTNTVQMTDAELEQFRAFQADRQKKAAEAKAKEMRTTYREMVDEEIEAAIPELMAISQDIKSVKNKVLENFKSILEMKQEMFRMQKGKDMENQSHTFTNTKGDKRVVLGVYVTDGYLDTADEGIAIIREYIESLATDDKSRALVGMVMKLLAKDQKGTLKASRIIQLRKIAEETGDARFMEGVKIIEEAYSPAISKTYIRAEYKDANGIWKPIPLGMTEA